MRNFVGMAIVAFAVMLFASAESVQAQGYIGGGHCVGAGAGLGGFGNFGLIGSPYALGQIPVPPYFALHPPVYYSAPVARSYGYSPFAYPGTERTPEAPQAAKVINNPHVTTPVKKEAMSIDMDLTQAPLEIINPFVNMAETRMVSVNTDSE